MSKHLVAIVIREPRPTLAAAMQAVFWARFATKPRHLHLVPALKEKP